MPFLLRLGAFFNQLAGNVLDGPAPIEGGHAPREISAAHVGLVVAVGDWCAVKAVLIARPLPPPGALWARRGL